ncbi:hypothetical protein C1645_722732 [Glomus cerebriforme]|uniref:Uncharacterized protein n=1 Tax=Glomus cerebriforme TaxID=658196 RepID=A0A397TE82_9GLOM|nr:hypothetical protein C1645_722732 [Glomus cerebriforme]
MASEVQAICSEKSLKEILVDLHKTKSVEFTINRIFDGNFLEGTHLDLSLKVSKSSFPIHLLDKKDYVTTTKSLGANSIRANNCNDVLLPVDETFYTDFTKTSNSR